MHCMIAHVAPVADNRIGKRTCRCGSDQGYGSVMMMDQLSVALLGVPAPLSVDLSSMVSPALIANVVVVSAQLKAVSVIEHVGVPTAEPLTMTANVYCWLPPPLSGSADSRTRRFRKVPPTATGKS